MASTPSFRSEIPNWWDAALYPSRGGAARRQAQGQQTIRGNKATATNRPCLALSLMRPVPKERLRVSNWIVQRLYNYAVNKTVEL